MDAAAYLSCVNGEVLLDARLHANDHLAPDRSHQMGAIADLQLYRD